MAGGAQGCDSGITTHEADKQSLDCGRQAQTAGDDLINAGRDKSGAAGDDNVSHLGRIKVELGNGLHRKVRGKLRIMCHTGRGRRQGVAGIESVLVNR